VALASRRSTAHWPLSAAELERRDRLIACSDEASEDDLIEQVLLPPLLPSVQWPTINRLDAVVAQADLGPSQSEIQPFGNETGFHYLS
jgi:hypothetical protein